MKTSTLKEIKDELQNCSREELLTLCTKLVKFKKENKELLTYLLHESFNDAVYIEEVKEEIDQLFDQINIKTNYLIKKGVRKILSQVKKYIRYSKKKQTEIELLIYFCAKLKSFYPSFEKNKVLSNTYQTQIGMIQKAINTLDEDLRYDYGRELEELL